MDLRSPKVRYAVLVTLVVATLCLAFPDAVLTGADAAQALWRLQWIIWPTVGLAGILLFIAARFRAEQASFGRAVVVAVIVELLGFANIAFLFMRSPAPEARAIFALGWLVVAVATTVLVKKLFGATNAGAMGIAGIFLAACAGIGVILFVALGALIAAALKPGLWS